MSDELYNDEGSMPVAEPAATPVAPPAPLAGPRVFPQHYTLLFASVLLLVGASSVWERAHIFGKTVNGPDTLAGTLIMAMALYQVIVGFLNITHGRLRGMLGAFMLGLTALFFGVKAMFRTFNQDMFLGFGEIGEFMGESKIPVRFQETLETFPREALGNIETIQDRVSFFLGQWGPGTLYTFVGGLLVTVVFLKAVVGGKKKEAPVSRRKSR